MQQRELYGWNRWRQRAGRAALLVSGAAFCHVMLQHINDGKHESVRDLVTEAVDLKPLVLSPRRMYHYSQLFSNTKSIPLLPSLRLDAFKSRCFYFTSCGSESRIPKDLRAIVKNPNSTRRLWLILSLSLTSHRVFNWSGWSQDGHSLQASNPRFSRSRISDWWGLT